MEKTRIAIFGSSSHIAKGLIYNFAKSGEFSLHLYTQSPDKVRKFLGSIGELPQKDCVIGNGYKDFRKSFPAAIINCVGVGTMNKPHSNYSDYFLVTEKYDNLIIEYLLKNPRPLYISLSSGVVYGGNFQAPVKENTSNSILVNHITPQDYYALSRLNAEAKHRALSKLRIVDLRIFSYFSRFINLRDGYFITEVLNCILNKKIFVTDNVNIIRDYVHPNDLFTIILKCLKAGKINDAFDVTSLRPVEKQEILNYFSLSYNLKYKTKSALRSESPTGAKNIYYSKYNKIAGLGYKPQYTSLETIKGEARYILKTLNTKS
jgi:nucleoside-diphosphate-sugar epimerase